MSSSNESYRERKARNNRDRRKRQREGLFIAPAPLDDTEDVETLIALGLLDEAQREDRAAVGLALRKLVEKARNEMRDRSRRALANQFSR